MEIERAIKEFIEARQLDKCSIYTIRDYRRVLAHFSRWLLEKGVTDTDDLQLSHLRGWMSDIQQTTSQRGKPYSDSTVQQFGLHMIAFCHWLEHEGVIEKPITTRFNSRFAHF